jgi:oxygen-independent coproporphyrinogen-3 oxidase
LTEDWHAGGFGVYVHWPFCAAKCPYCDFNSHVRYGIDQERWRSALVHEVRETAGRWPGRRVGSIFFGGGTPSLMPPETVAAVTAAVAEGWELDPAAEVTLEANPTSVEAGRFRGYRDAGVNRLSLGVQALNDADLKALGRLHTAAEALAAFEVARATFPRVSFDLIYARQNQDRAAWAAELRQALDAAVDHLSLYQLTIEDGTRFGDLAARGRLRGLPDPELAADLYEITQDMCGEAGQPAYEVSNHARPGAEGRHNLVYWRYGDYTGIGPGAHGRLSHGDDRLATVAHRAPDAWLEAVETLGSGLAEETLVPPAEQAAEMLMMGLRLTEGVDPRRYARLAGAPLDPERLRHLARLGMLTTCDDRIIATDRGRGLLDALLKVLLFQ